MPMTLKSAPGAGQISSPVIINPAFFSFHRKAGRPVKYVHLLTARHSQVLLVKLVAWRLGGKLGAPEAHGLFQRQPNALRHLERRDWREGLERYT